MSGEATTKERRGIDRSRAVNCRCRYGAGEGRGRGGLGGKASRHAIRAYSTTRDGSFTETIGRKPRSFRSNDELAALAMTTWLSPESCVWWTCTAVKRSGARANQRCWRWTTDFGVPQVAGLSRSSRPARRHRISLPSYLRRNRSRALRPRWGREPFVDWSRAPSGGSRLAQRNASSASDLGTAIMSVDLLVSFRVDPFALQRRPAIGVITGGEGVPSDASA